MLNTANAPSKPTTPPTTNPTRRATTARLFSFNTYLPDTLVHYAPECVEGKFCEVRLERRPGPRCFLHFGAAVRLLLVGSEFPWLLAPVLRLAPSRSPKKSVGRIASSFGYYGGCRHLFAPGEHPQSCISIHRCYKLKQGGAMRGVLRGDSRGIGAGIYRILDMNFGEFLFHALR